jgi:branched-chain amino acid transport system permease protein
MISPYTESILIFTGINIILGMSWYIPSCAGLISLGQGGFMAVGAYVSAFLTLNQIPFYPALLSGAVASCIVAFVIGLPALRIKGMYLILLTIAFGEIVRVFFLVFEPTGGAEGLGGIFPNTTLTNVYTTVILVMYVLSRIRNSHLGRAMEAVREDENAAESLGVDLTSIKLLAFGAGGFVAGLGGGFYAHYALYIHSDDFGMLRSIEILVYPLVGGITTMWGSALGASLLTSLTEFLRVARDYRMEIYGTLIVLVMIFRPQGILTKHMTAWRTIREALVPNRNR